MNFESKDTLFQSESLSAKLFFIPSPAHYALIPFFMSRIAQEKQVVGQMIRLYCRRKEKNRELCPSCKELLAYAHSRLDRCPFGDRKKTCHLCPVHCYKRDMRERMRQVMRYAGPRMLWVHPVAALRHVWREFCSR